VAAYLFHEFSKSLTDLNKFAFSRVRIRVNPFLFFFLLKHQLHGCDTANEFTIC